MKKRVKVYFAILPTLFLLIGCATTTPTATNTSESEEVVRYTITFESNGGSSVSSITADEGASITKPANPSKTDNVFKDWHYDSALTELVTWPITLERNLTLYAKWQNSRDYFLMARDNTIDANQFEYDFNLSVLTSYGAIDGPGAIIDGNTKYNSTSNTSFLQSEERSGLLIGDGKVYKVKTGTDLATFKVNKSNKLMSYSIETVSSNFKYDSSSFAKALFEFTSEQITSVPSAANQKFEIIFSGSFTGLVDTVLVFLNHPVVDAILQRWVSLPDHDSNLSAYVTFENNLIKTYEYDFTISVVGASLTFHYDLNFTKIGSGVTITPPDFSNVAVSETAVNSKLDTIKTALDNYRSATYSGYNYRLDTQVDYPQSFAIDATIQGRTMRKIQSGIPYFWNRIELDSDYKNTDLYKSQGVVDYERYRVKYANQSVYDCEDRVWPASDIFTMVENYSSEAIDSFYFLLPNSFYTTTNVSTVEEATSSGTTTYSLGLSSASISTLLDFADDSVRFDLGDGYEFDIFSVDSDLDIKTSEFDVVLTDGVFTSLTIDVYGRFSGDYEDTNFAGPLDFEISLEITTNDLAQNYVVPTQNSEVDLANS